jgi:hypothetical protein
MDLQHSEAAKQFIDQLRLLRLRAGSPSLGRLAELSNPKIPKTTLHDHLAGRRVRLPPWEVVSVYVSACRRFAESTGLDVSSLGSLQEWYEIYCLARKGELNVQSVMGMSDTSDQRDRDPFKGSEESRYDRTTSLLRCPQQHLNDARSRFCSQCGAQLEPEDWKLAPTADFAVYKERDDNLLRLARSMDGARGLLAIKRGPNEGATFVLDRDVTTLGRSPQVDITLSDKFVSNRHALIYRQGAEFFIKDLGSLNGIFINGRRIEESLLDTEDEFVIGGCRIVFIQPNFSS